METTNPNVRNTAINELKPPKNKGKRLTAMLTASVLLKKEKTFKNFLMASLELINSLFKRHIYVQNFL